MASGRRVVVVGGGPAGLAAAALAARAGARVTLLERRAQPGGRARTRVERGFAWNLGAHALYQGGAAMSVLQELGIAPAGCSPSLGGGLAYRGGRLHALPGGTLSLLASDLLGVREKVELARVLGRLRRMASEPDASALPLIEYLTVEVASERVRELLLALVRLTSYAHDPALSAADALAQLALAIEKGVRYLDGGWQRLVSALRLAAHTAGAELRCGARVEQVVHDEAVRAVELVDGERIAADAVVLALDPRAASALVDAGAQPLLARAASACVPVRAACLDLGLARLPEPRRVFALGLDRPLYYSVHSAVAKELAPEGAALVQLARYLAPGERPARRELDAEFDAFLDALQPGWREHIVVRRLMTELTVAQDLPQAARGGLAGRTPGRVAQIAGLWLAGDWIGPSGMLLDAALASARAAALGAAAQSAVSVAA